MAAVNEAPTAADVLSLRLSLPQMLDLALGTPEVGVVNLNILHNFLHVLLHQINLRTIKVEYRGENADRIKTMVTSSRPEPALQLQEYSITDATGNVVQRAREEGVEIEIFTEGTPLAEADKVKVTRAVRQDLDPEKKVEAEKVIFVEPSLNGILPTAMAFKELERSVSQLQEQYQALEDLTGTPEVIQRLKGRLIDPVADVWQVINITKRVDAAEQGIDKLTEMVKDVMTGDVVLEPAVERHLVDLKERITKLEETCVCDEEVVEEEEEVEEEPPRVEPVAVPPVAPPDVAAPPGVPPDVAAPPGVPPDVAAPPGVPPDVAVPPGVPPPDVAAPPGVPPAVPAAPPPAVPPKVEEKPPKKVPPKEPKKKVPPVKLTELEKDVSTLKTDVARLDGEMKDVQEKVTELAERPSVAPVLPEGIKALAETEIPPPIRPERRVTIEERAAILERELEKDVAEVLDADKCMEAVKNVATTHNKFLNEVNEDIESLRTLAATQSQAMNEAIDNLVALDSKTCQLSDKVEDIEALVRAHDGDITKLLEKTRHIQLDMEKFGESMDRVTADKEKRDEDMNMMMEQIELLKTVKADKEDLEDALADKADTQVVNRKVSHDQFDAACDVLTRGLEDAIEKLTKQESIWQQTLDEVQSEIAAKADRGEMMPLKDFMNKKLKSLQEKLKSMIEAKREIEAAGTKKLLRDVQCISCDKEVVMKTEELSRFRADPLPCTTSIKPYLTYELDQVRKQQKKLPHSRNMIQYEAVIQEDSKKIKTAREEMLAKTPRDHLCNRYCGGSHTVTTPQQRVMRVGHFLSQWGPEVVQLTDGFIKGKDGQMYRSRMMPSKLEVCGSSTCWECQSSEDARPTDRVPPTSVRKPATPSRRNNNRKRNSKKHADDVKEAKLLESEKRIMEMPEKPLAEEGTDYPAGIGSPDEVLYEADELEEE